MDEYGKKLIEQGACEERQAIIKKLENLVEAQKLTGIYGAGCPSVESAIEIIRSRDKKPSERAKIVEELRDWLLRNHGSPSADPQMCMWRQGWLDATAWIEQRRDE